MTGYRALTALYHTPTNTIIPAGAWADLSHLTPDERLMLADVGAVEIVEDVPVAEIAAAPVATPDERLADLEAQIAAHEEG